MCQIKLCRDCNKWKPNGGITSMGIIYDNPSLSSKLGNCEVTGKLKNELNGCDCEENITK